MCGISGYLDFKEKVDRETLYAMTDCIRHRGPDDEGYLLFSKEKTYPFRGKDTAEDCQVEEYLLDAGEEVWEAFLGFGHRRLSILDLSAAGHQPMQAAEGKLAITYNGEIYNYIEIREELRAQGFSFFTDSDTEVVLAAYQAWGQDCVHHFNGMWAFVIYDAEKQRLFCSRDRLGAKPFYYFHKGGHFVFGSEIKQLCQDKLLPKKLNEKLLLTTLMFRLQDFSEETLIEQVFALPGGCNLTLQLDLENSRITGIEQKQYWDLDTKQEKEKENNWYSYIRQAVRLRLRSDAPIGIMVSGGVDSTFLINEICRCLDETGKKYRLDTFTSCYENAGEHDETYYAHMVNEACSAREHLIYPDEKNTLGAYKKMIWHYENYAPFSTLGSFMTLEEVAKTGIKVIINGQGGDESMLGYERYFAYYLKDMLRGNPIKGLKAFQAITKHSKLSTAVLLKYMFYFGMPNLRISRNKRMAGRLLKKSFLDRFQKKQVHQIIKSRNLDEMIYNEIRKTQLTHILRMDDRGYMAHSLESRVPFIDYQYLEKAVKLVPMEKIKDGFTKYLLREKMDKSMPKEVVWRKSKNGWSSPAGCWVERFDKAEVENMLKNPRSERFFRMDYVRKLWQENRVCQDLEAFFFAETFMRLFDLV